MFPAFHLYKKARCDIEKNKIIRSSWSSAYLKKLLHNGVNIGNIISSPRPNQLLLKNKQNVINIKSSVDFYFPLNFSAVFLKDDQIKARINLGMDKESYLYYIHISNKVFKKFCSDICHFALKNQNSSIVIRPHPLESKSYYRNCISYHNKNKLPSNISIDDSLTVWDWVLVSKTVISNWSTVLYDCHLINKSVYVYYPFNIRDEYRIPVLKDLPHVDNLNDCKPYDTKTYINEDTITFDNYFNHIIKMCHSNNYIKLRFNFKNIIIIIKRKMLKYLIKYLGFRNERIIDII